jgi:DNA-binding XRE family transcriptional regulator
MDRKEFSQIRNHIGRTQTQMAQLLGISLKAIQSFEQGWRNIPVHIERQVILLLTVKRSHNKRKAPGWVIRKCPMEIGGICPAWEFQSGQLCRFINGTVCLGEVQKTWHEKIKLG